MKKILMIVLCAISVQSYSQKKTNTDICVYGATSAGVIAAVQASKMGKSVVLISTDKYVGGTTASGLGATDINNRNAIGGLAREFYTRIYDHYQKPESWKSQTWDSYIQAAGKGFWGGKNDSLKMMWVFEPQVAQKVFADMLKENNVKVIYNEKLSLTKKPIIKNGAIQSVTMENGNTYSAKMFIDATYEGDLMAKVGVTYTVGRESNSQYGETKNGVLVSPKFYGIGPKSIDPYIKEGDSTSGLLPFIEPKLHKNIGEGDNKTQAYCYRFTLSTDPANKLPITKPENYNPLWFEHWVRRIMIKPSLKLESLLTLTPLPNKKTDTNHADFIGASYEWAEGDYAKRKKIAQMHKDYVLGTIWTLANDPRIPKRIRDNMKEYGLAKDEFKDNDNFPFQLYVREARRMVSDYVMTQHNYYGDSVAQGSIGLGTYWLDSHVIGRFVDENGNVRNEGPFWENKPQTYPVAYKSIVPKKSECTNLLVPVCLSATHAVYGSLRMEPQYMVFAQSAVIAASLSIDNKVAVQDLPYEKLEKGLYKYNQILTKEEGSNK